MPTVDVIADAGGWAFSGFLAISIIVALIRGDLVPGFIHRREIARGDRLEAEAAPLVKRTRILERGLDRCRAALRAASRRPTRDSA